MLEFWIHMIFSFHKLNLDWRISQHQFLSMYIEYIKNYFLTDFFEARWIHNYQKDNFEVSLQADPEVRKMRDMIAKSAGKALQSLLSILVEETNQST